MTEKLRSILSFQRPKLSAKEEENKWYNHGVDYIEVTLGLELTICEKAIFRQIVRDSVRRHDELVATKSRDLFSLGHEAIDIFLQDYYGIPGRVETPWGMTHDWTMDRWDALREGKFQGRDRYAEFYKKRQEESHFP